MGPYIALARVFQLSLTSLIGLACIYFGYKLFSQIPIGKNEDGSFSIPSLGEAKFKLAPGSFFALLGTAMIIAGINKSVVISETYPTENAARADAAPPDLKQTFDRSEQAQEKPNAPPNSFSYSNASPPRPNFGYSQAAPPPAK